LTPELVGRPVRRREDERILRGLTRYLDDIDPPGAAHVAFVRSPFAHARVAGITVPDGLERVFGVITASDLDGRARDLPVQGIEGGRVSQEGHPLLARDEVRYVGQIVAAVVAGSRAEAEDAAELVEVDYEPLAPVLDARRSEDTLTHWHRVRGDVEGLLGSAAHVVRASHSLPRLAPVPMEARGAIASYDQAADMLTVWVSAQDSHRQLAGLAAVLDRHEDSIHVIVPDVGGAFGSKGAPAPETMLVAAAAITSGRTVKWTEDREENFVASYQGRGMEADVELALGAHHRDAHVRRVRHSRRRRRGRGQTHEQGADRPVPRSGTAGGGLLPRVHSRRRGARARHRPTRAAPAQPDQRASIRDGAGLDLRLR
jgi:carbon-monoxide dehydrogenase large subunit